MLPVWSALRPQVSSRHCQRRGPRPTELFAVVAATSQPCCQGEVHEVHAPGARGSTCRLQFFVWLHVSCLVEAFSGSGHSAKFWILVCTCWPGATHATERGQWLQVLPVTSQAAGRLCLMSQAVWQAWVCKRIACRRCCLADQAAQGWQLAWRNSRMRGQRSYAASLSPCEQRRGASCL